eukprot:1144949-Pelagomonas_calceolata.AAC.1
MHQKHDLIAVAHASKHSLTAKEKWVQESECKAVVKPSSKQLRPLQAKPQQLLFAASGLLLPDQPSLWAACHLKSLLNLPLPRWWAAHPYTLKLAKTIDMCATAILVDTIRISAMPLRLTASGVSYVT